MDEILIKDIGFKPLDDEELIKIFKTEYYIRNRRKAIKRIIVILELLIFFILAIIDPKLDKVLIPVTIDIIALTIEYFIWMISKYKKIIKHFDIDYFFKSSNTENVKYIEVVLDDIVKINSNGYHAMVSTLDGKKVMEKIDIPCIEDLNISFDKNKEESKPHVYLIISGLTFFAVETLDKAWWQRNISKMR